MATEEPGNHISVEVDPHSGGVELMSIDGEQVDLSARSIDVENCNNGALIYCIALRIAHIRAERGAQSAGQAFAQLFSQEVEAAYPDAFHLLQSRV